MRTTFALMSGLVLASASIPHAAQAPTSPAPVLTDQRWTSWLGCWTPTDVGDTAISHCVVPTADGRGVRLVVFADDTEVSAQTIIADDVPRPVVEEGCAGETRARWSADEERVFLRSELRCDGKAPLVTTGITALYRSSGWMDVSVAEASDGARVRVRRYARSARWPAALAHEPAARQPAMPARIGGVTGDDVTEAYGAAGAIAVQAWLMESQASVAIDKRTLVRMVDQGVSEDVIDLLVARAYPARFSVGQPSYDASGEAAAFSSPLIGQWSNLYNPYAMYWAPFGFNGFYGLGGYPLFWQLSGYRVVAPGVPNTGGPSLESNGRAINGRGYTRVSERPQPAVGRGSGVDGQFGGGGSGSGGSGGSGGGQAGASPSGYSGGGATGIRAVPR